MPNFRENLYKALADKHEDRSAVHKTNMDAYECRFHYLMQNPVDGAISFAGADRGYLHNGLLGCLKDYFDTDGNHIFGCKITTLDLSGVQLSEILNHDRRQVEMPSGVSYICELIAKNPKISEINLSFKGLVQDDIVSICEALRKNEHLKALNIIAINPAYQTLINEAIATKPQADADWRSPAASSGAGQGAALHTPASPASSGGAVADATSDTASHRVSGGGPN